MPLLAVLAGLGLPAAPAGVDFARDVLPVLADNCFHCHGPDPATRQGGLRLDTRDGAFRKRAGRTMLVPSDSAGSEVVRRVLSGNADEVMPPPDSHRTLTAAQKDTLRRWVDGGAKWGGHWAFAPLPATVPVPPGGGHPVDRFVADRLASEKLPPAPAATREAWLRRVTLDLSGLPPTVAELDAFLLDRSPTAFERVADRLLGSPRFGERMASDWLDLARYADTHGYQMDRARPAWPYRDWVVRAFNANRPFDRFLTDQLAGDLLPGATTDQKLATAFNRLHMQNEEGGVDPEEFRVAYVADRVATAGTAFLGLTLDCCRCHDHKYDPLTQKDYYGLFAFFGNIDESGQTSYFTTATPTPALPLPTADQEATIRTLRDEVRRLEDLRRFAGVGPGCEHWFRHWLATRPAAVPPPPGPVAAYSFEDAGGRVPNTADPTTPGKPHDGPKPAAGKVGGGVTLTGEDGYTFPGVGHFGRSDPFTLAVWLKPADHADRAVVLHHSKAPIDAGSRGYELLLERGRVAFGLCHFWPGDALKVVSRAVVPVGAWTHVAVTHDGSGTAAGVRVFLDGRSADLEVVRDCLRRDVTYPDGEPPLALGHRFRDRGFKGGTVDELRVFDRAVTPLEAADLAAPGAFARAWHTPADKLAPADRAGLAAFYEATVRPGPGVDAELRAARRNLQAAVEAVPEVMAMRDLPAPRPAFVLVRGAHDAPGEAVTASTPAALPPLPADAPRNRLGLARWLTDPSHPLTARVAVNRLWQMLFGTGLVETSDNFGTTGSPPTHPDLLDWLARDFVAHGWDSKRTLRQLVLSDAYRRSSVLSPELLARDPENKLLARGPARRLTAEMLRDQALFVSGLLVEKEGGPSVFPDQPAGLWDEAMGRPKYPTSTGADRVRRSLYTVWKRTAPHPQLVTFDAADRSNCAARRQATSTPLQALALLNDPQHVEAARALADRMLKDGGADATSRVTWLCRTVWGRPPTDRERAVLVKLLGELPAEAVAQVVLAHDAAVVRR